MSVLPGQQTKETPIFCIDIKWESVKGAQPVDLMDLLNMAFLLKFTLGLIPQPGWCLVLVL